MLIRWAVIPDEKLTLLTHAFTTEIATKPRKKGAVLQQSSKKGDREGKQCIIGLNRLKEGGKLLNELSGGLLLVYCVVPRICPVEDGLQG